MFEAILGSLGLKLAACAGAIAAPLLSKKIRKMISDAFGDFVRKGIVYSMSINTKDPYINDRLNLAIRCFIDIAEQSMPYALGEEKKKFVMSIFSKSPEWMQTIASAAIDDLCAEAKKKFEEGNSPAVDKIIADAAAAIAATEIK